MSEVHETFEVVADLIETNTSDEGVDIVNVFAAVIEGLKADPNMTIELWETVRLSIQNSAAIMGNLIDEEIARLKTEALQ